MCRYKGTEDSVMAELFTFVGLFSVALLGVERWWAGHQPSARAVTRQPLPERPSRR